MPTSLPWSTTMSRLGTRPVHFLQGLGRVGVRVDGIACRAGPRYLLYRVGIPFFPGDLLELVYGDHPCELPLVDHGEHLVRVFVDVVVHELREGDGGRDGHELGLHEMADVFAFEGPPDQKLPVGHL